MKSLITALTLSLGLVAATTTQAALIDRGGGLIYDTDIDVTWLANANANGVMTWNEATTWAANLSYYDSVRNATYTDWRLPTTLQLDETCNIQNDNGSYGDYCTGSEMGHLFYNELGGVSGVSITANHNANYNLFQNIQPHDYWSSTSLTYWSGTFVNDLAWAFAFGYGPLGPGGDQHPDNTYGSVYAWAVRSGDVAIVPVPAAAWLFGSGLLGLLGAARMRRRRG